MLWVEAATKFRFQTAGHVSCGADRVVENVWPYLLPPDFADQRG